MGQGSLKLQTCEAFAAYCVWSGLQKLFQKWHEIQLLKFSCQLSFCVLSQGALRHTLQRRLRRLPAVRRHRHRRATRRPDNTYGEVLDFIPFRDLSYFHLGKLPFVGYVGYQPFGTMIAVRTELTLKNHCLPLFQLGIYLSSRTCAVVGCQ